MPPVAQSPRVATLCGWMRIRVIVLCAAFGLLAACDVGTNFDRTKDDTSGVTPVMRWDHRPEAATWTSATMTAVATEDARLAGQVPGDIAAWCPGYADAGIEDRRAFWVGLMSALAKHESTWNPRASGGGGRYIGLLQISPNTANNYNCIAQSAGALKDGNANLACATKIIATQVGRDGVVAGKGNRGVGRDWGPFRKASKRADMAAWTRTQAYCKA